MSTESRPTAAHAHHIAAPLCTIIPPYLLQALASSGDRDVAHQARATLRHDTVLRAERAMFGAGVRPAGPASDRPPNGTATAPSMRIHDCRHTRTLPGKPVRGVGDPPTKDITVTQAWDGLRATWDLWQTAYGRNSVDGKGLPLIGSVHYGKGYDNAFWNGAQMVFGDGDGQIFLSFTRSIDVIGHELAHGVTQYTAGLTYQGQSGALNESISDVFGSLVKQRHLGQTATQADWLIGADLLAPGVHGRALRDMANPGTAYDDPRLGRDPQPGHMRDYVTTDADNGGVHINSGIPNRAFVLVARALGGPAWERAGRIWVDTITGNIGADCDFATFARLTVAAATARYAAGSPEVAAVRAAWDAVGVSYAAAPRGGVAPAGRDGGDPAPGPRRVPGPGTEVTVRREGGFAGLVHERTVTLADLPHEDSAAWSTLLAQPEALQAMSEEPSHPDAYCYGIACATPRIAVKIAEPGLPDATRALLERALSDPD